MRKERKVQHREQVFKKNELCSHTPGINSFPVLKNGVFKLLNSEITIVPVSYTHLDVYKRQQ